MAIICDEGRVKLALAFKNYNAAVPGTPALTPSYWMAIGRSTPWGVCALVASVASPISAVPNLTGDYSYFEMTFADINEMLGSQFHLLKTDGVFSTLPVAPSTTQWADAKNRGSFQVQRVEYDYGGFTIKAYVDNVAVPGQRLGTETASAGEMLTGTEDDNNPPPEDENTLYLDEMIGYFKVVEALSLLKEDASGSIVFRTQRFSTITDANAFTDNGHYVYLKDSIPYADELPIIDFRQIAIYEAPVATVAAAGQSYLIPYPLLKGSVQEPFVINPSNNALSITLATTHNFSFADGTYSAESIAAIMNLDTTFASQALAYAGDGVLFVRGLDPAQQMVVSSASANATFGFTADTYANQIDVSGGNKGRGRIIYLSNERVHLRYLETRDTFEIAIEF